MNYKQCAKELLTHENILIVTHRNPDGDTVASAAALCSALRRGGRTAWLFRNEQISEKLLAYCAEFFAPEDFSPKYTVAVDVADAKLLSHGFEGKVDLCIDHHPTNSGYAAMTLVKHEKAACAELVLELIQCMNGELTPQEATLLYIGLSTDTGCFQYANTNSQTLAAASELLRLGARQHEVSQTFFRKVSLARLQLEGMIYSGMSFHRGGKIVVAIITQDMIRRSGATKDDFDDRASLAGRAEGSVLNVTIREQEDGASRVSVRSNPGISSSDICAAFGGGGHDMAAGCNIACPPEKARALLLAVIDEVWPPEDGQ